MSDNEKPTLSVVPDNVVPFTGSSTLDTEPTIVLETALKRELKEVIVLGITKDNTVFYASSTSKKPLMVWRMECFKQYLLELD